MAYHRHKNAAKSIKARERQSRTTQRKNQRGIISSHRTTILKLFDSRCYCRYDCAVWEKWVPNAQNWFNTLMLEINVTLRVTDRSGRLASALDVSDIRANGIHYYLRCSALAPIPYAGEQRIIAESVEHERTALTSRSKRNYAAVF